MFTLLFSFQWSILNSPSLTLSASQTPLHIALPLSISLHLSSSFSLHLSSLHMSLALPLLLSTSRSKAGHADVANHQDNGEHLAEPGS